MRVVIWGLSVLATIWAWGCQSSTSSGTSWSWLDRGRISRSIQSGTTSTIEEAKIVARKGDTIEVTYEVAVRRGSIQIEVWRPLTPWGRPSRFGGVTLNETRRGTFVVSVDELFTYDIWIKPVWFGGTYDVSWKLRAARLTSSSASPQSYADLAAASARHPRRPYSRFRIDESHSG